MYSHNCCLTLFTMALLQRKKSYVALSLAYIVFQSASLIGSIYIYELWNVREECRQICVMKGGLLSAACVLSRYLYLTLVQLCDSSRPHHV